jgi:hypothetical protein
MAVVCAIQIDQAARFALIMRNRTQTLRGAEIRAIGADINKMVLLKGCRGGFSSVGAVGWATHLCDTVARGIRPD